MKSLSVVSPSPSRFVELGDPKRLSPASSVSSRTSTTSSCSSLSSSSRPRTTADGNKIRSRLLNTLGIVQQKPGVRKVASPPVMRKVAPVVVPLKYSDGQGEDLSDSSITSTGSESTSSPVSRKSMVAFDEEVSVVHIPKHQEYSKRIRSRLWCDKRELRTMAARNTLEYQAEGWNPSTVVEDEGFITTANGERIHPVHLHRLLSSPFLRPMKIMQLRPPPM